MREKFGINNSLQINEYWTYEKFDKETKTIVQELKTGICKKMMEINNVTGFLESLGRVELATSFFGWLLLIRFCIKYCFNFRLFNVHQPQKFPDFVTKITELESEKIELLKQIMEERVAENIKLRTRIKNKIDIIDAIAKFKPK
ncbi:hypothetical protein RCL_jg18953.t1 [Rhizophagus clarus]|uniref:Uncharacterized protein n=1 Tax=Rhizophagus clarus TaxID=94130 RepID=A0A8H3ME65_9GLOM|nr:hypothetical protein RCL_jg18953.t1 [Rhizophagus clarus]